jgi:hypothetical protein
MEAKGREEANHTTRYPLAGLSEAVVFGRIGVGSNIKATANPVDKSFLMKQMEVLPRDVMGAEFAWPKHSGLSDKF